MEAVHVDAVLPLVCGGTPAATMRRVSSLRRRTRGWLVWVLIRFMRARTLRHLASHLGCTEGAFSPASHVTGSTRRGAPRVLVACALEAR